MERRGPGLHRQVPRFDHRNPWRRSGSSLQGAWGSRSRGHRSLSTDKTGTSRRTDAAHDGGILDWIINLINRPTFVERAARYQFLSESTKRSSQGSSTRCSLTSCAESWRSQVGADRQPAERSLPTATSNRCQFDRRRPATPRPPWDRPTATSSRCQFNQCSRNRDYGVLHYRPCSFQNSASVHIPS